jgi:hypothetical protein
MTRRIAISSGHGLYIRGASADAYDTPLVGSLFFGRGPAAIGRGVIAIRINAIDRMFGRGLPPHVG